MKERVRKLIYAILCMVILLSGALVMKEIIARKQKIQKRIPKIPLIPVQTARVRNWDKGIMVYGEGTVTPLKQIKIVPQVAAK